MKIWLEVPVRNKLSTFWPNGFLTFSYEPQSGLQSSFIQPIRPVCIPGFVTELFLGAFFVAANMKLTPFYHPLLHLLLIINLTGEQKSSCLFEMIAEVMELLTNPSSLVLSCVGEANHRGNSGEA